MVVPRKDLTGMRFGKLTVIGQADDHILPSGKHIARWLCKCDCEEDKHIVVLMSNLTAKKNGTKSCGCIAKEVTSKRSKKYNKYDLSGEYGVGYDINGREFYFDLEDYDKIKNYCWRVNKKGYVVTKISGWQVMLLMHRIVLPNSDIVDHINHNAADNRKCNLRDCNNTQNSRNRMLSSNNTSGVCGVTFNKKGNKWQAQIGVDGERLYLGMFECFEQAVAARLEAEARYFGEFAPQRHLFEEYRAKSKYE